MTKNKLKKELLECLVKFDFLFLQSNSSGIDNRYCLKNTKLKSLKNSNFLLLNPLEMIKNIKQILRLLQFLNNQKNSQIFLKFEKDNLSDFLEFLLSKKFCYYNNIHTKNLKMTESRNHVTDSVFFIGQKTNGKIYNKLFQNNKYLIAEINAFLQKNDFGAYKIFNDLSDWQKIVFFSLLLKKTLLKKG